ncbi:ABSCISIC ACID-INSENSITIVE 5-like protein 1 [Cucurbita maxima]|uniref:ABSCISIC ACID-INSENSITIVE 5-like protein 1 n=1 Tax=Cucurbita maxima TaxID=3661 RepID=A0A6J1K137_CUCMA|nr:ABSCISIC ACID-INSENSITIVE 5-like protein 1 [Cucurbita maxima]
MENSGIENMAIGQMMPEAAAVAGAAAQPPSNGVLSDNFLSSLNKNNSILPIPVDEIQYKSGKNFGCLGMDEILSNLWNVEGTQNQIHSQTNELKEPQNLPFMAANTNNSRLTLPHQASAEQTYPQWQKFMNIQQNPCYSQQGLGERTLEDFLVKAGMVQESSSSSMKQLPCSMVDLGLGMGGNLGQNMSYHNHQNAAMNFPGNFFSTNQMLTPSVGVEPSDNSSIQISQSLTDWGEHSRKKRIINRSPEFVVQRRQHRMIKNRESAARSRARKQAYTVELEAELNQLKEENVKLKQTLIESEMDRQKEMMQRKELEKRQKPTERLMTMRRAASMDW